MTQERHTEAEPSALAAMADYRRYAKNAEAFALAAFFLAERAAEGGQLMDVATFIGVRNALDVLGFGDDVEWSENAAAPASGIEFASEAIFVICNSGMKNTVARGIYERVMARLAVGGSAHNAFGHKGKAGAIDYIWANRHNLWAAYLEASDKVAFCASLPWIGGITKYHLAKNFGVDVAKPDVHLQRLADHHGETVQGLCERLGAATGFKARTVDLVLWRACAEGVIDSRSGVVRLADAERSEVTATG